MTLLETNLGSGSIPKRQGKVRDVYDLGDRLLLGRDRSHQRVRLGAAQRHSRQGARPDRA